MRVVGAKAIARGTSAATTLGLEVGGVLTGQTLVLPPGSGEVSVSGAVSARIGIGQSVRWRVVSGPAVGAGRLAAVAMEVG